MFHKHYVSDDSAEEMIHSSEIPRMKHVARYQLVTKSLSDEIDDVRISRM